MTNTEILLNLLIADLDELDVKAPLQDLLLELNFPLLAQHVASYDHVAGIPECSIHNKLLGNPAILCDSVTHKCTDELTQLYSLMIPFLKEKAYAQRSNNARCKSLQGK